MKKEWQILRPDRRSVEKLTGILNCHPAIASILVNRKIVSPKDASNFLSASLNHLSPPFTLKDMDIAIHRILRAITHNEKILIFGDYDVDGITATTILLEFFRSVGADVSYYIPHRIKEGYGLQRSHIINCAWAKKINLIITVDCGSGSHDAVTAANAVGIDVIITDHHIMPDTLPPAVAVINPMRYDCPSGFGDLAGVGVAFYLLICLRKKLRDQNFWKNRPEPNLKSICNLVALGTLADMVPLTNDNRILAKTGLDIIGSSPRPGVKALMEICGINKRAVNSEDVVFGLAPRLNSAGRVDHASLAVELLITKNMDDAEQIGNSLDRMNRKRRSIETEMLSQIEDYLKVNPSLLEKNTLVLSRPDWHLGILGIVASRVMKKYFCPVVLISTADGIGKGSARSIPGVNLYDGLCACAGDLESFGGHSMAAGLKIKTEKIERFESKFENFIGDITKPDDFIPKIYIDYELAFDDISKSLIDEIESLNPFGTGNPEPIFMARDIMVVSSKIVGKHHRRMLLKQSGGNTGKTFQAIHFNGNTGSSMKEGFDRIAFRLRWNRWNGGKTSQMVIEEV
ncbi:MAG: single-stranded-DNA-specific exonuclease RecJ [Deltaproteobacteria bacterium]|nr:MAG: single-stranded-DNA-specific exonuclease RecJ [Deltaproteobacteria bacterium]